MALGGKVLDYELERKRVKNINLRVRRDGSVYVSASPRVPLAQIEAFLRSQADRILAAKARFTAAEELRYETGDRVPVWGRFVPLRVLAGAKNTAVFDGETLTLTVKDPGDPDLKRRTLEAWQRRECEAALTALCRRYHPHFAAYGVAFPTLRFQKMRSRWGSCRPQKGALSFNTRLAEAPPACAEYVAVHELAHFLQPNHSPTFYEEVERVLPDWEERRALLRQWERETLIET